MNPIKSGYADFDRVKSLQFDEGRRLITEKLHQIGRGKSRSVSGWDRYDTAYYFRGRGISSSKCLLGAEISSTYSLMPGPEYGLARQIISRGV